MVLPPAWYPSIASVYVNVIVIPLMLTPEPLTVMTEPLNEYVTFSALDCGGMVLPVTETVKLYLLLILLNKLIRVIVSREYDTDSLIDNLSLIAPLNDKPYRVDSFLLNWIGGETDGVNAYLPFTESLNWVYGALAYCNAYDELMPDWYRNWLASE